MTKRLMLILVAVVLLLGGLEWLRLRANQPQVILLPLDTPKSSPVRMLFDAAWFWLRVHVIGQGKSILVRCKVFELSDASGQTFDLPPAGAQTNRVKVWALTADKVGQLERQLTERHATLLMGPGIQTLSGMQGTVFAGYTLAAEGATGVVGIEMEILPRLRRGQVDLTSKLKVTDAITNSANAVAIQTNLLIRTRVRVPQEGAVFGLCSNTNGKSTAVLLVPRVQ